MGKIGFLGFCGAALFVLFSASGCEVLHQPSSGRIGMESPGGSVEISFNQEDRRRIRNYYRVRAMNIPPGLAKKKKLPPGLQKKLVKNGKLPPGLERKALPMELEQQLEFLPAGYVRFNVGGSVVLVDENTRVIVDVIYDVSK